MTTMEIVAGNQRIAMAINNVGEVIINVHCNKEGGEATQKQQLVFQVTFAHATIKSMLLELL